MFQWKIITLPTKETPLVRLKIQALSSNGNDNLAPLRAFFFEAPESAYPRVIYAACSGVGSGFNSAGVIFPDDLDEDDEPIAPNMVEVYDPIDSVEIPKTTFLLMLLDVAETTLKVREQDPEVAYEWKQKMQEAITRLRAILVDEMNLFASPAIAHSLLAEAEKTSYGQPVAVPV